MDVEVLAYKLFGCAPETWWASILLSNGVGTEVLSNNLPSYQGTITISNALMKKLTKYLST